MNSTIENELEQYLESILIDRQLSHKNIVQVTLSLMLRLEQFKQLSGNEKKDILISLLKKYITVKVTDQVLSEQLNVVVDTLLPTVIDTVIQLDKRKIKIKVKKLFKTCC